jgi:hypothetical protein
MLVVSLASIGIETWILVQKQQIYFQNHHCAAFFKSKVRCAAATPPPTTLTLPHHASNNCWTNIISTLLLLDICSLKVLLAPSIVAVNISHRLSLGTTDPDIQALIVSDLLFGESEESSLSLSTH